MPQGPLPFKYEEERSPSGATALAGLPAYLDLARVLGLARSVAQHVCARQGLQGWTDAQMVMSLVLLQLAGGECVDDLRILESDEGFRRVLQRVEADVLGLSRAERRRLQLRWRKERKRAVPSPSSVFRFLEAFQVDESGREAGKAWIPQPTPALQGLRLVNRDLIAALDAQSPKKVATLDQDATLVEVHKEKAFHCYKGFKAYQPTNVYWAEHDVVLHSEFRDGNVPAGHGSLPVLKEALEHLPAGVEKVFFRADTAAYEWDLLLYMARGVHPRFGVIEFSVSVDVTPEFRAAVAEVGKEDWEPLRQAGKEIGHEYAEVCYAPKAWSQSKKNPDLRFLAIRQRLGAEDQSRASGADQLPLPFPTEQIDGGWYKLHGIVTNRLAVAANDLIHWHHARCGKSEEAHAVMKEDLAGGRLPSGGFGQNAAWWAIMILAFNLNSAMKRLVLGGEHRNVRLKTLRFQFICLAGRVIEHARELIVRLSKGHPRLDMLIQARRRLLMLAGAT